MKLITPRLSLREISLKDAKDLIEGIGNIEVSKHLLPVPHPYSLRDAKYFINHCKKKRTKKPRTEYELSIELKSEKKVIGGFGLIDVDRHNKTAHLGYWLAKPYWRKGYITETAKEVIDFAFNKIKLRKLTIPIFKDNIPSNSLAKKLGAKLEGTLIQQCRSKADGRIHDENIYGLFKGDWVKVRKRLK